MEENKKAWNAKLKFVVWADRVSIKKSIGTSPFQLVYGTDAIFPASLGSPVMKYLQEQDTELNPLQRRINQIVEVQQIRDQVVEKASVFQGRAKLDDFQQGDLVLKWDARHEDKGKHGKFDHLWKGPYLIAENHGNNSYTLQGFDGDPFFSRHVNGKFLKHYIAS